MTRAAGGSDGTHTDGTNAGGGLTKPITVVA